MTARVTFGTDSSGTDHPLQANAAAETVLTATELEELTMDFLFAGVEVEATGPGGAQTRSTLSFVKNSLTVRDKLWKSAYLKPRVKARLVDAKGRLDKEELLGYTSATMRSGGRCSQKVQRVTSARRRTMRSRRRSG